MSILYHLNTPPPVISGVEAVHKDIDLLSREFGGNSVYLLPTPSPGKLLDPWTRGLHVLEYLRKMEKNIHLHLVLHSEFFPFLYLNWLRRPIVYSVVSGLGERNLFPPRGVLNKVHTIAVSSQRDAAWLFAKGFDNVVAIKPGIDLSRFQHSSPPDHETLTLLAGSAPWTAQQFRTKGVDTLLRAVQMLPRLRLLFLWRGVLFQEMLHKIRQLGISDRIEILNQKTDVNEVLKRVHASVVISDTVRHVKAYPHSLLESLAAGRPVITSTCIPISAYVRAKRCGVLVNGVQLDSLLAALKALEENYPTLQENALAAPMSDFSLESMLSNYKKIFDHIG